MQPQSDTIEIGHVARTIVRGWRAIAVFTAFGLLMGGALILFAPRKFTGTGTLVLKSGGGGGGGGGGSGGGGLLSQVGGLGDLTGALLSGKSPMETEVEIMQSHAVIAQAIDSLHLQAKVTGEVPLSANRVIARIDAPGAFAPAKFRFTQVAGSQEYTFTGKNVKGRMTPGAPVQLPVGSVTFAADAKLPPSFKLLVRDSQDAILWVDRHLVVEKEKGEVASITYDGDDSLTAAAFPNTLFDVYMARRRTLDRGINQRRVEMLTAKNDSMEAALLSMGAALRRQQESSGVTNPAMVGQSDLQTRAVLRSKLTDTQLELGALNQLLDKIRAKTITPRELSAYPGFVHNPTINGILGQLSNYEQQLTQLRTTYSETEKNVQALRKSITDAEARLMPYAETYAAELEQSRIGLETQLATVEKRLALLPGAVEVGGRLERDMIELAKLSAVIQAQIVEAKLAAIGEGGDVRPLDRAVVPKKPSFPKPALTLAVGAAAGLFLGLIAALLVGSVGRWVRDPFDVERSTGVPALEFDPSVPLILSNGTSRTIIVAPITPGVSVSAVVNRLAQTASSRSLTAAVLELPDSYADVNGSIRRLEAENDLVIVQLPSLVSDTAAAALQHTRPVLLVAPGRRIERRQLLGAVQMLKRLEVPVASIVMSNGVNGDRALTR